MVERMFASTFALARPTFEALVKGLWLYYCATDEQLELHTKGKELDQIRSTYWKTLSSLTHVGHTQLRHWISPTDAQQSNPGGTARLTTMLPEQTPA
ncbi:MAG: DUF6988 family protein [Rhodoferax sp.]